MSTKCKRCPFGVMSEQANRNSLVIDGITFHLFLISERCVRCGYAPFNERNMNTIQIIYPLLSEYREKL